MSDCKSCQANIDDVVSDITSGCSCCYPIALTRMQQRIAELEATVDTLHSALRHLAHNAKASGAEMGLALDVAEEALESTPRQNLNAVKREVARGAFIAGATDAAAFISQQLDLGKTDIDLDAGAAADKYVKTNYPSDKE